MSYEIKPEYGQLMLPTSLDDWLPQNHPARFMREFVDALDLKALGFKERTSKEGRPNYSANLLLKVWLWGSYLRITSTRELERACLDQVAMLWLTGRNAPDHNTIHRFIVKNRKALRMVFRESVRLAMEMDMVGMVVHAVDGTKVQAACSPRTTMHRPNLEYMLRRADRRVEELLERQDASERAERGEVTLPEELANADALRRAIRDQLDALKDAGREHMSPHEPDARVMKCGGSAIPAYNAQAVVDAKSGIIVAEEITTDGTDNAQLVPMIDEVKETLGHVAEVTVADGGYLSGEQLAAAEEKGYEVTVALGKHAPEHADPLHATNFTYDADRDVWICPHHGELAFETQKNRPRDPHPVRIYRCGNFRECPFRDTCSTDRRGRSLEVNCTRPALDRLRAKHQDPHTRELLRIRSCTVEPAFARVKSVLGFRRWTLHGKEGVRAQWDLICTVLNLRKIFAFLSHNEPISSPA